MRTARRSPSFPVLALHRAVACLVFLAGLAVVGPLQAASFGHARLLSAPGQALRIEIPVLGLTPVEVESAQMSPAPDADWHRAGLVPPVALSSLHGGLLPGVSAGAWLLRVVSDQAVNQPVVDLLIDLRTASGEQRHQVSLLAGSDGDVPRVPLADAQAGDGAGRPGGAGVFSAPARPVIRVRKGDTMFAIARRHAVEGVTVYQMMIALQRANPQAFIHGNLNLVRAGARLAMPDRDALTAISDREARRLFHEQVLAFQRYRDGQRSAQDRVDEILPPQSVIEPGPEPEEQPQAQAISNIPPERVASGDQLRLSSGRTATASAGSAAGPGSPSMAENLASGLSRNAHASETREISLPDAAPQPQPAPPEPVGQNGQAGQAGQVERVERVGQHASAAPPVAVSASPSVPSPPAPAPQASVPPASLPSAGAAVEEVDDGSAADDQRALEKAADDAQARISILEENVKNLNKALQSQGEAATDLIVDSAKGLRQSLTEVATAVTEATIGDEEPQAQDSGGAVQGAEEAMASPPAVELPAQAPGSASAPQSAPALEPGSAPAPESTPAPASAASTPAPAPAFVAPPAGGQPPPVADTAPAVSPAAPAAAPRGLVQTLESWFGSYAMSILIGLFVLLLIIAIWILRRINLARSGTQADITPEMVQEKLSAINLDLNQSDGPHIRGS